MGSGIIIIIIMKFPVRKEPKQYFHVLCSTCLSLFLSDYEVHALEKWASLIAQLVKNWPAMQETLVQFLGWEDPLEKGQALEESWFQVSENLDLVYFPFWFQSLYYQGILVITVQFKVKKGLELSHLLILES